MIYGSICSGIEAATLAWGLLGWKAAWFSEIEKFPSAVLSHRYPNVPNLGDMRRVGAKILSGEIIAPEVLVGGTPCQAFSVAGLREGLSDPRGQLTISYVRLADAADFIRQRRGEPETIIVWENVPGVLSDKENAFGCFLAGLAGEDSELKPAGKKWTNAGCVFGPKRAIAWRVLDAQYFGVAQRRRRVFVVASARKGFDPTRILFEFEGVRRDIAPSREARKNIAATITGGVNRPRGDGGDNLIASTGEITHTLKADGFDGSEDSTGRGTPIVAHCRDIAAAITSNYGKQPDNSDTARGPNLVSYASSVRRLMPIECERLQGMPDDYTNILIKGKPAKDGPRYKAIGNSKAVPVVRWIGRRIESFVNNLNKGAAA